MCKSTVIISLALGVMAVLSVCCCADEGAKPENRWEDAIRRFEELDVRNTLPEHPVLFVGSSSIGGWHTAKLFPELTVLNRGFGGSTIADSVYFAHRIIVNYAPRLIVFYAGDNDVAGNTSPETVAKNYQRLIEIKREALGDVPVVYISIKKSGARLNWWPKMQEANTLIEQYCQEHDDLYYIDLADTILDAEGQPDDQYFMPDRLHLNAKGYDRWSNTLRQFLREHKLIAEAPAEE